ncbi:MAG: transcriptional regulator [archaeon]|nr:transcriptional regulator [archaeon]
MPLTRDYKETINKRAKSDPEFAKALLNEAITLFINGEPDVARLVLKDLVNSTIGFETLAAKANKPNKSLQRMLSAKGNPTMDNLTAIFKILRQILNVKVEVNVVHS